jgi:lysophospholipase L1-like esterase
LSPALNESSVFIGASIIHNWALPVHNAGIAGQTSSQVLQRFTTDVLNHGYARVVIQVGSNDVLQQLTDPPGTVSASVARMAQEARAANMGVFILSLGPITWAGRNLDASASAVNVELRALATAQGYGYVDIFTPLQGHPEYFVDGLHPNVAGYAVIEKAVAQVLM